jgi:IclR family transcriptional regulator, acetate operon repressor
VLARRAALARSRWRWSPAPRCQPAARLTSGSRRYIHLGNFRREKQIIPLSGTRDEKSAGARFPLGKAVRILEAVTREPVASSLADLSESSRLPKPTVHRLAAELERLALITRDPLTRRFHIGRRLEQLAVDTVGKGMAQNGRRQHMERLAEKVGERVNIGVISANKVVYVHWVESAGPFRIHIEPGTQVPVHCSANGKLLLAYGPETVRERILASGPFPAYTPQTITSAESLRRELQRIRRESHSEDNEEFLAGVCCIAVPVRNRRGEVVAGLAVMAPSARLPLVKAREYLPDLEACAEAISAELGRRVRRRPKKGD